MIGFPARISPLGMQCARGSECWLNTRYRADLLERDQNETCVPQGRFPGDTNCNITFETAVVFVGCLRRSQKGIFRARLSCDRSSFRFPIMPSGTAFFSVLPLPSLSWNLLHLRQLSPGHSFVKSLNVYVARIGRAAKREK